MKIIVTAAASFVLLAPVSAQAPTAPAAATPAAGTSFTAEATPVGVILDVPAAKAVVDKYIPGLLSSPKIDMARTMTLKQIQGYLPAITEDTLAKIDADFAKLPPATPAQ